MRNLLRLLLLGLALLAPASLLPTFQSAAFAQRDPQSQTVYVTRTGKKYHLDGCRYLRTSRIPISLKDAQSRAYTPCLICRPPN